MNRRRKRRKVNKQPGKTQRRQTDTPTSTATNAEESSVQAGEAGAQNVASTTEAIPSHEVNRAHNPDQTRKAKFWGFIAAVVLTILWTFFAFRKIEWRQLPVWSQLDLFAVCVLMFTTIVAGVQWAVTPPPPDEQEARSLRSMHLFSTVFVFLLGLWAVDALKNPFSHIAALISIYSVYIVRWSVKKIARKIDEFDNTAFFYIDLPSVICFVALGYLCDLHTPLAEKTPTKHQLRELYISGAVFFHLIVSSTASGILVYQFIFRGKPPEEDMENRPDQDGGTPDRANGGKKMSNKLKIALVVIAAVALLASIYYFTMRKDTPDQAGGQIKRVGVLQIVSHPVLDATRDGIKEGFKEEGFVENKDLELEIQNAQGEVTTAQAIARKFVQDKKDLLIPLGTQATQASARTTSDIPIVFGAVIDPVGAGLVKSLNSPGTNVTGVRDVIPYRKQIELLLQLAPTVKKIGMVYNPGEQNSQYAVNEIKQISNDLKLELILAPASNEAEVLNAARSIVSKVDAFYTAADNTVNAALDSMLKVATQNKKPFLVSDPESVKKGGLATVGYDYFQLGKQTAHVAVEVLKGKHPREIPVQDASSVSLYINEKAVKSLGYTIPEPLRQQAVLVP